MLESPVDSNLWQMLELSSHFLRSLFLLGPVPLKTFYLLYLYNAKRKIFQSNLLLSKLTVLYQHGLNVSAVSTLLASRNINYVFWPQFKPFTIRLLICLHLSVLQMEVRPQLRSRCPVLATFVVTEMLEITRMHLIYLNVASMCFPKCLELGRQVWIIESRSQPFTLDIYLNSINPSVKDFISATVVSLYTAVFSSSFFINNLRMIWLFMNYFNATESASGVPRLILM